MKYHLYIFLLFTLTFISSREKVYAQQTIIEGRVIDADTKEPLIGASVVFKGNSTGTVTDGNGEFELRTKEEGMEIIQINYIGFMELDKQIKLNQKTMDMGTISLKVAPTQLKGLTVRGSLSGQQRALNQQRTADKIENVISADQIGSFPDLNVAEAMQRVPGVNIQRDKGEGSIVSIRGTPPHFTTIQINGEQIPSVTQNGSRNEALDLIPADELASMVITKAPTPDMDGDAIGGVINLKTPVARRKKMRVKADAGLGYSDISGGLDDNGKIRFDKRFFSDSRNPNGKLGILVSGSYYKNNNSEHRIEATWQGIPKPVKNLDTSKIVLGNYQYRFYKNIRERIGADATIDYRFNDNHKIIFKYMYNRRGDNDVRNRLRFDMDRGGTVYESLDSIRQARVRRLINIWDELKTNNSFKLEGHHELKNWKIDWDGYYSFSKRKFTSDRGDFSRDGVDIIADNPGGIYADIPHFRTTAGEESIYNPFLYNDFRRYEEDFETTKADNAVGRIDFTHFFHLLGKYNAYFKFGAKYRAQNNDKYRDDQVLAFNDPNHLVNLSEAFLRSLSGREPEHFLYSDYRFGPMIGRSQFENYINSHRRLLTPSDDAWDSKRISLEDTYGASENIGAAYIMGRAQIAHLMILAGVRYEQDEVNYNAFDVHRSGTDVTGTPISNGNKYDFILPNLHLRYNIDKYTDFRFSALFNYARPNFVDIVPYVNYDADAITLQLGNPDLMPAHALNLDLMFEKYYSNIGILSVGAYYKSIDNFEFTRIVPSLMEDFPGYPNTKGFKFRQEQNGTTATVAGLEINFLRTLDFLPGFLKYFNANINYTYAYSNAFTQDRKNISMPGQAANTFNISLAYDKGSFSGRISGNYNGTFIKSLASEAKDDIYQQSRFQLDANGSFKLNKHWQIFFSLVNITNAPNIRYQGKRERISRISYYGWRARAGLSFKLK